MAGKLVPITVSRHKTTPPRHEQTKPFQLYQYDKLPRHGDFTAFLQTHQTKAKHDKNPLTAPLYLC